MPEQRRGVDLTLEQIKSQEGLNHIGVYENNIPAEFNACDLGQDVGSCLSQDHNQVAVFKKVTDGGRTFGVLLKAKATQSDMLEKLVVRAVLIVTIVVMAVVFVMLYFFFDLSYIEISPTRSAACWKRSPAARA